MGNQQAVCAACHRPTGDAALLCPTDQHALKQALEQIPGLLRDLRVTATRQDRMASSGVGMLGGAQGSTRLPYNAGSDGAPKASAIAGELMTCLLRTAREYGADHDSTFGGPMSGVPDWIIGKMWLIRISETAGDTLRDVEKHVRKAQACVDRPVERWYAGPCDNAVDSQPCGFELYAKPQAVQVKCGRCGTIYETEERRTWLRDAAEDQLADATTCARALTSLGIPITPSMVRNFAARKEIFSYDPDPRDPRSRDRYRVGDVADRAQRIAQRKAEGKRAS